MEALGSLPSSLRMPSTFGLEKSSQFLKVPAKSAQKLTSSHGLLQPAREQGLVLNMEPSTVDESSQFGGTGSSNPKSGMYSIMAVNSAASSVVHQISELVEEALTSHTAKMTKVRDMARLRREMIPLHQLRQGGFAENTLMYRQIFVIRSYEVGPDKSTSIREIFSLLQEMALNHVQLLGISGDGFGATRAMNRLGLIWVVTKMQVDVERYPVWPEVIEIDSWVASAGKNGMRRDWIMRSYKTGEVLARATSTWCMMNGTTRRLSKIPVEVRSEIEPNFMDQRFAFSQGEPAAQRVTKLDDVSTKHRSSNLKSTPTDLDMNQHVNNLKYINWVLESIPAEHIHTHKLASIVLEYRRECHSSDVVESLTSSRTDINGDDLSNVSGLNEKSMSGGNLRGCCEYSHLLQTQDADHQEILRGKTTWRPRGSENIMNATF